jgi:hypothetical protein
VIVSEEVGVVRRGLVLSSSASSLVINSELL